MRLLDQARFCERTDLMVNLEKRRRQLLSLLLVLLGNTVYVLGAKLFLLPAGLISCGTTGLALAVNGLTGLPITTFILLFNLAMLCLGWVVLGKQFALTTVFSSLYYPVALEVLNRLLGDVQVTGDLLMNTLFAGMSLGLGLGIVMRGGASTGGMDIPPLVLNKFFRIPVPVSLWTFDFCILLTQMMFHTLEDLLYGIVLLMVISVTLNRVLLLGTSRTEVKIISDKALTIREAILHKVDRGVTLLHGQGGFLGQPTEVILSVVSNRELPRLESLARDIDPDAFIIVSRVTEVWGRGFTLGKHYDKSR